MAGERAARWLLFAVFASTLPVVYYLGEVERAPTLRLAFFAALTSAVALSEGVGRGLGAALFVLGPLQALLYAGLLYGIAALLTRGFARFLGPRRRRVWVALLAGACLGASLFEIYDTPLSSTRPRSSLAQLFQ